MAFTIRPMVVLFLVTVVTVVTSILAVNGYSQPCLCNVKYTKIGCYDDPGSRGNHHERPLSDLLLNWRDRINWTDGWNDHLKNMACRCAELAKEKGYRYYGLQYYGECWSGSHSSALFKVEKSDKCWGYRPDYKNCNDDSSTECIGQANHNYIYEVMPEVPEGCTGGGSATTTEKPTIDPCDSDPCQHGGECRIPQNSVDYDCECPENYTGRNCEEPKGRK